MSACMTPKEIDAKVFATVQKYEPVTLDDLWRFLAVHIYPNCAAKRREAIRRSCQRLRRAGRIICEGHSWRVH